MLKIIFSSKNPRETRKLAVFLLDKVAKLKNRQAAVIAMEGELGAGKTTFVQGLAEALGVGEKIKSPTFNLIKGHSLLNKSEIRKAQTGASDSLHGITNFKFLYHIDCYRLCNYRDLKPLGIGEILDNPENLVAIEWSDRIKEILPKKHIRMHFDHVSDKERKITVRWF